MKMPRMDGFDVLAWLRAQPNFPRPAVVMFSTSDRDCDIEKAKAFGADDYRLKSGELDDLVKVLHELHARWLVTGPSMRSESVRVGVTE
jgi:CheY-like chemotaxis protein